MHRKNLEVDNNILFPEADNLLHNYYVSWVSGWEFSVFDSGAAWTAVCKHTIWFECHRDLQSKLLFDIRRSVRCWYCEKAVVAVFCTWMWNIPSSKRSRKEPWQEAKCRVLLRHRLFFAGQMLTGEVPSAFAPPSANEPPDLAAPSAQVTHRNLPPGSEPFPGRRPQCKRGVLLSSQLHWGPGCLSPSPGRQGGRRAPWVGGWDR